MVGSELMAGRTPPERVLVDLYPRPLEAEEAMLRLRRKSARTR